MTRARAAVLVLAGLTLAACGNVHPGAAAVVDGKTISMKSVDQAAEVYCKDALKGQQPGQSSNADIRRGTVSTLVSLVIARKLADEEGITPKASDYELTAVQKSTAAKSFPGVDPDVVATTIEDFQELSLIRIALGEKVTGQTATAETADQVAAAGQAEITKAFKGNDVEFAPRFGLSNTGANSAPTTGSLSVSGTAEAEPGKLPAAQRCS